MSVTLTRSETPSARLAAQKVQPTENWFWSTSASMGRVLEEIRLASKTHVNVLIIGETGTGKELAARALHEFRRGHLGFTMTEAPFVPVNCGALPEALAESLLFGHERGAFTSARERQQGKFESARKGTLFLDEIQTLATPVQIKLLRVIQHREFERLGAKTSGTVDCQIVAATNVPLELLVDRHEFRRDLYYRLNICPIYLPALRHRREDITELAHALIKRVSLQYRTPTKEIAPEALTILERFDWPGNVRQLEHALIYASLRAKNRIEREHLPGSLTGELAHYLQNGSWNV